MRGRWRRIRMLWHTGQVMSTDSTSGLPDFLQARRPSRVYRGSYHEDEFVVSVLDSALTEGEAKPYVLQPGPSRGIRDYSNSFHWGSDSPGTRQLAVALLLDVTADAAITIQWHKSFAETYVRKLESYWTVPEIDIAFWLYCFQNAPPAT